MNTTTVAFEALGRPIVSMIGFDREDEERLVARANRRYARRSAVCRARGHRVHLVPADYGRARAARCARCGAEPAE